jgi:hypothetical protein
MFHPSDYGAAVLLLTSLVAYTVRRYWFRYWAYRILYSLSPTQWRTFDEVVIESGCRAKQTKDILFICMLGNAVEYQPNQLLDYQNAEVRERANQVLETEIETDIVEFLEFRLKRVVGRKYEISLSFEPEPAWLPAPI